MQQISKEYTPDLISWNITRRCNLNCAHCYLDARMRAVASERELTTPEGFRLMDGIAEIGPGSMLILTGGEPLLRRDIFDLAEYGVKKKLIVVLGTNGYLVTEKVVRKLCDIGVQGLGVSLDSLNPEVHDRFRGKVGSWQRVVETMETCHKQKLDFQVQTSVTSDNVSEIPLLAKFARDKGARAFNIFFLVCTGRGQQVTDISPTQYEEVLSLIVQLGGQYKDMMVRVRCAPYINRIVRETGKGIRNRERGEGSSIYSDHAGCPAGSNYCRITPKGEMTPCPYLPLVVGDLKETSFGEIWNQSPALIQLRDANLQGKCGRCDFKSVCGGCRARAFASSGDYLAEDSWCLYEPEAPDQKGDRSQSRSTSSDKPGEGLAWSKDATARFEKAPPFVRKMVMRKIEEYAVEKGYDLITGEVIDEAKTSLKPRFAGFTRPPRQ